MMSLLTWLVFGAVVFGHGRHNITWQAIIYALLSRTVIRIVPVMLCLLGVSMRFDSKLFLSWFGPRGLASIVFIVMVIAENLPGADTLTAVVTYSLPLGM